MTGEAREGRAERPPRCSIVVRAYNEQKRIGRLLAGVARQTLAPLEIVLVDSGSTDGTVAVAQRECPCPLYVVHIRPEQFTFGRSLNLGMAAARGEFAVVASAHVYPVYPDWLERLLAPFRDPQVALVYGRQRGDSQTRFSEQQVFARWYPGESQPRQAHPFCNNANAAIRRSLWERQPYDETLTGLEDLAWANWAMSQGLAIAYAAEAEVVHVHEDTLRGIYNRYRREAMAFKRIFPHERFGLWDLLRLFLSNAASDGWQAARQGKLWKYASEILWYRLMQFCGTYHGYRQPGLLTEALRRTFYYPNGPRRQPAEGGGRGIEPIRYHDG